MTAPTQFNARQLAVLAEARALGGWEVRDGKVRRGPLSDDDFVPRCPILELPGPSGLPMEEMLQIGGAADWPTDPRRPALLAALGMEVT
jgi:hypothetical protein